VLFDNLKYFVSQGGFTMHATTSEKGKWLKCTAKPFTRQFLNAILSLQLFAQKTGISLSV